ncbi:MAG: hypothetical protein K2I72_01315, partial [Bacilli bacterium]|nr:hypothetical protein [Bacilli bacterium]
KEGRKMIQEILGCCWIKRQLFETPEEKIVKLLDTEHEFLYWLTCLNKLVNEENFLTSDPKVFEKARNILREKRFEFKNPDIISLCNSILKYCSEYDALPQNVKYGLQREWVSKEAQARDLPILYRGPSAILNSNAQDYQNLMILLNVSEEAHFTFNSFHMQSTITWLINKHPEIFQKYEGGVVCAGKTLYEVRSGNHILAVTKAVLELLEDPQAGMRRSFRKKVKGLRNQLEKFDTSEQVLATATFDNPKRKRKE